MKDSSPDTPMMGEGCRAKLFDEQDRDALKAACVEDSDIWADLPPRSPGPDCFDDSIDPLLRQHVETALSSCMMVTSWPACRASSLDPARRSTRSATYYRPHFRGPASTAASRT